ncbi:hypothetical protein SNE40_013807 [Patella caerulea]|uniref:EF-hand domain-containing protein n=1 Tax=Patella caerulea TaxID=87958 RepID=A0AAN8PG41_PATCE
MALSGRKSTWSSQNDATDYLEKHRIMELFNNMTSNLIYHRPDDPKQFMIEILEKLQKSKNSKGNCPSLFDDSNIRSVFGILDPTNKGFITLQQYKEAMTTLGVKNYPSSPELQENELINMDTFYKDAKKGLEEASATYAG